MTDTAGPFDGSPWAEAQWARHAAAWAPSGVYGSPAASTTTGDLPLSVSGRSVGLGAGRAWVRGFGFERTGSPVLVDPGANTHASFSRRDRIVLRRNLATHSITQVVIQGTPASPPAAPALTQSETGSWDLPLFSFLVPPASGSSITSIIDERPWIDPDFPGGPRTFERSTAPGSAIASGGSNETGFGPVAALNSFRLYGPRMVSVRGMFRAGGTGAAAECSVKINGVQVGDKAVTRSDVTTNVDGVVALAAGTHTIALRVDASGGAVTWTSGRVVITEGAAE